MTAADYSLCSTYGPQAFYDTHVANDWYCGMCERGQPKALWNRCIEKHTINIGIRKAGHPMGSDPETGTSSCLAKWITS